MASPCPSLLGLWGFDHVILEDFGFFECLRAPLPPPSPSLSLRRWDWRCVWLPSLSLSSAPVCKMSESRVLTLPETPASTSHCLGGPQPRCSAPLPHGSQDKGIIFGTRVVTQQMNYLSLGMEERRHFAGLLNSLPGLEGACLVRGPVCVARLSCTRRGVLGVCALVCVHVVESGSRGACRPLCGQVGSVDTSVLGCV